LTPLVLDKANGAMWEAQWEQPTRHARGARRLDRESFHTETLVEIWKGGDPAEVPFSVESIRPFSKAVVLNTVDFIYGHSMPFLLDAARFRSLPSGTGLIAIVQPFLRWMVPRWVDEIWTVGVPLRDGRLFFPRVSERIEAELTRFDDVHLSHAFTLPLAPVAIRDFVGIAPHDFSSEESRVTFIWREDPSRLWCRRSLASAVAKRVAGRRMMVRYQLRKIVRLFTLIRKLNPDARFTVAGLGRSGHFPHWIEDHRVHSFDEVTERALCQLYSDSRLVIGVHGSHLLLPNLLAGMGLSLMPTGRWYSFGQDLMPYEGNEALGIFTKRVLPVETPTAVVAAIAASMLGFRDGYWRRMADPFSSPPRGRAEG
jgi:hypothetical protein